MPFPNHFVNPEIYLEHPYICYNLHPLTGIKIVDMDINFENVIYNDLIQEGKLLKDEKFNYYGKKYIGKSFSSEDVIKNLIKVISDYNGIFSHINKILCEINAASFLGTVVYLLNDSIKKDTLKIKCNKRLFRKAFLSDEDITEYFKIYKSGNKNFFWNSFTVSHKETSSFLHTNFYDFNSIFVIDFDQGSFGIDISNISSSKIDEEVLLPAMSLFEIKNMCYIKNNQGFNILQIELNKFDKNNENKIKSLRRVRKDKLIIDNNIFKIINRELILLKRAQNFSKVRYTYHQDENNFFLFIFSLKGPEDTPYENGLFHINIEIPQDYPNKPPKVFFITKIYHPNISLENGYLMTDILHNEWKPSYSIVFVMEYIISLLINSNGSPLNIANREAYDDYYENKLKFQMKAEQFTNMYAKEKEHKDKLILRLNKSIKLKKSKNELFISKSDIAQENKIPYGNALSLESLDKNFEMNNEDNIDVIHMRRKFTNEYLAQDKNNFYKNQHEQYEIDFDSNNNLDLSQNLD